MDSADNNMKLAIEKTEARLRLEGSIAPDRLNENWRFGKPQLYARGLIRLLEDTSRSNEGTIHIQAPDGVTVDLDKEAQENELMMGTIGSDRLLSLHLSHFGKGICLFLEKSMDEPIIITYETSGLFVPSTSILAMPGVHARIIERHLVHNSGVLFATRDIKAAEGSQLHIELEEHGSGSSRAMNITNISALRAHIRHLTRHSNHAWAREETITDTLESDSDIRLYSANRLNDGQVLDQHTLQRHTVGNSRSNLLYKNVLDGRSTAIFAGNIFVAPGAHQTDAYQANRNMMLSEQATVHSLPGLEILADRVRCSHGSASAPMDEEQLFYLRSRGITRHEAQLLVAEGFLADVWEQFVSDEER